MAKYPCRVCGLEQRIDQWNPPSLAICSCCATEFGLSDRTLEEVRNTRMAWLIEGAGWFKPKDKPEQWHSIDDLVKQLKDIPFEWL